MEKQTVFTREDYNKLSAELNRLKTEGRDDIAEKIKEAKSFGDLSENDEYRSAKREMNANNSRIRYLESMIRTAVVISTDSKEEISQ